MLFTELLLLGLLPEYILQFREGPVLFDSTKNAADEAILLPFIVVGCLYRERLSRKMFVAKRGFAKLTDSAKAAQVATQQRPSDSSLSRQRASSGPAKELRVTRLPNDLLVVSEEADLPVTRITIAVKAGSRHEPAEVPGLAHCLRNAAPLTTRHCTAFGLSRNLEHLGASLGATTTRDHIIYSLKVHRNQLSEAIKFLSYVVTKQEFKPWEVKDAAARMDLDLDILDHHPEVKLIENLHRAAYRDGLGNSLFAPKWASHQYKSDMLKEFVQGTFRSSRISMAAIGIGHDEILNQAAELFKIDCGYFQKPTPEFEECAPAPGTLKFYHPELPLSAAHQDAPAKYGGGEYFEQTLDHLAYVAVAVEGAGINKPKDALALALLREVLGVEPHIKWSKGQNVSPLIKAATGSAQREFAVAGLNICHSDSGLFGFTAVAHARDIGRVVQSALGVLRQGNGVDLKKLQDVKNRLVASLLMRDESLCEQVNDYAVQALASGHIMSAGEAIGIVDQIRAEDLMGFAKKITSGKATMAAVGNLSYLPHLDQLM